MSIRIAGELVVLAEANERKRIVRLIRKHMKQQSSGRCCDACNCLALHDVLGELTGELSGPRRFGTRESSR